MLQHSVIIKMRYVAGCFLFWVACINHTLYHRGNGGIRPCLWRSWSRVLEIAISCCIIVGCVATFRCFCFVPRLQVHSKGTYFYCFLLQAHQLLSVTSLSRQSVQCWFFNGKLDICSLVMSSSCIVINHKRPCVFLIMVLI